jgi:hypothetical protein
MAVDSILGLTKRYPWLFLISQHTKKPWKITRHKSKLSTSPIRHDQQIIREMSAMTSAPSSEQLKLTEAVLKTVVKSTESGIDYSKEIQQELDIMNQILSEQGKERQASTSPSSTQFKKKLRKEYRNQSQIQDEETANGKVMTGVKRSAANLEDDIDGMSGNTSGEAQTRYQSSYHQVCDTKS